MSGAVEGPLSPAAAPLAPASPGGASASLPAPRKALAPLAPKSPQPSSSSPVADVTLELDADLVSPVLGARLVVAFAEVLLYLKGQVPL
jgi:hypothetical protein